MSTIRTLTHGHLLGTTTLLPVELVYDSDDPWAVTAMLGPQMWLFARDVLATGCYEPAGELDVQVRPDTGATTDVVIALSSPDGAAEIGLLRGTVEKFLAATEKLVPAGCECLDWDTEWARLTGGTTTP